MFPSRRILLTPEDFEDKSCYFSGGNEYIQLSDPYSFSTITVIIWYKQQEYGATNHIMFFGDHFSNDCLKFYATSSVGSVLCRIAGASGAANISCTNNISPGTWTFVACTYDNSAEVAKGYWNGNLKTNNTSAAFGALDFTANATIGINGSQDMKGNVSEAAIYNAVLSDDEIKTIYNSQINDWNYDLTSGPKPSNLKGWFRMGNGTEKSAGTTIYDMSGEGNNGAMSGMDATSYTTGRESF